MRRQGVADNPVLVGAAAILVILVMVLLSYNANTGLPFVPTYDISADVPGGANLVKGNDVRIGGARVGLVIAVAPKQVNNKYYAQLQLKLDKNIGPIPDNSIIEVRPRSTIGLKYIELQLGDSETTIRNGGKLPITQARVATEFEDLLNTFNPRVREGNKRSLHEFGNAFAGRGSDLNTSFGIIPPLFENLEPVARVVSAPSTRFADFLDALARAAHDTAVTGDEAGEVFANADRTIAAFAAASEGIKESLTEAPSTLAVITEESPEVRRYFTQLTDVVETFQPGAKYLPQVSNDFATITVRGTPAFKHLSRSMPKFVSSFRALGDFSADPQVRLGFTGLATFLQTINQPLGYITPAQTVCNYAGLFARNIASTVSSRDSGISWLRFGLVAGFPNPTPLANAEIGPADANSNFRNNLGPSNDRSNMLQSNPYPFTGQNNICAAGNEVTKGRKKFSTQPSLPASKTVGNPSGIATGKTTDQDTEQIGSKQIP